MKVKKIIKIRLSSAKKSKQKHLQAETFKSTPLNSKNKKKIHREMDKILKKIEEIKTLEGYKPRKKLKERVRIFSGGLPGLGKRR